MELFGDDEDNYKGESAYRKEVAAARRFWESGVFVTNNNEMLKEMRDERDRLYAAKRELADQRRIYNSMVARDGRANNLTDRLLDAVKEVNTTLPLLQTPTISYTSEKEAVIFF